MKIDLQQYLGASQLSQIGELADELAKEVFLSSEIGIHHRTLNH